MPHLHVNGVRIYYEEHGTGDTVLCVHGTSGSALAWQAAAEELSKLGRVIIYDRRGSARSERPEPYATSVAEHADDAAALLVALGGSPALVIGRSYGGTVAIDLALRYPERVRALALLEAGVAGLDAETDAYDERLGRLVEEAAASDVSSVAEVLLRQVLGDGQWEALTDEVRAMLIDNSPAVLAEVRGGALEASVVDLARIRVPVLLVAAEASPPAFRSMTERLAAAIPGSRTLLVGGGHMIDPAGPHVLGFVREVLGRAGAPRVS